MAAAFFAGVIVVFGIGNRIAASIIDSPHVNPQGLNAQLIRIVSRLASIGAASALLIWGGQYLGIPVATLLAGAGIGAWVSSMIGIDVPNSQITQFEQAIKDGEILVMVDVAKERVEEITSLVHQHHPQAEMGGTEPHIPAFP